MFRWLKWSILLLVKRWNQKQKVCEAAVLLHRNKQWRDYLRRRRGVNGSINVKRSKSTCAPDNLPAGARTRKPRGRSLLRRQRRREVDRGTARLSERSAEKMLLQSFQSRILLLELIWTMFSFCADRLIISSINRLIDWLMEDILKIVIKWPRALSVIFTMFVWSNHQSKPQHYYRYIFSQKVFKVQMVI